MALTDTQLTTLGAAMMAETDPVFLARIPGDDMWVTQWVNTETANDAWHNGCAKRELFESTNVTKFDNLTAGKRDAWKLMLDNAPIDMTRQPMRKAIIDIWGSVDSASVLQSCLKKATRGEMYLGSSTVATSNPTVSALKLNYQGAISLNEVSMALNKFRT